MPEISVITVVKNNASGLQDTYKSLLNQSFIDWECLIVLGKSKDESALLANSIIHKDSRFKLIIQQDSGIYEAMNLGLKHCMGELVWFMNSGDKFFENLSLENARSIIVESQADCVIGGYSYFEGSKLITWENNHKKVNPFRFSVNVRNGCHQSMIFRKSSLLLAGGFDVKYGLAADFKLVLTLCKNSKVHGVRFLYSIIQVGGSSHTQIQRVLMEKQEIRRELFPNNYFMIFSGLVWTFLVKSKIYLRGESLI